MRPDSSELNRFAVAGFAPGFAFAGGYFFQRGRGGSGCSEGCRYTGSWSVERPAARTSRRAAKAAANLPYHRLARCEVPSCRGQRIYLPLWPFGGIMAETMSTLPLENGGHPALSSKTFSRHPDQSPISNRPAKPNSLTPPAPACGLVHPTVYPVFAAWRHLRAPRRLGAAKPSKPFPVTPDPRK